MKWCSLWRRFASPAAFTAQDLRRALARKEFVFYYQPEVNLKTGKVVGVEALVRWEREQRIIPPNQFLPALEACGLMPQFTPYLFDCAFGALAQIRAAGFPRLFMSVNLSATQLYDAAFIAVLQEKMAARGISGKAVECEIIETGVAPLSQSGAAVFNRLRDLGVRLSVDDFGSGYSSFAYLRDLRPHKLKIDRDFIQSVAEQKRNAIILKSMINLGHALKMNVLIEGIETPAQAAWAKKNGCDMGQGFLFSRPVPLEMLLPFLKQNRRFDLKS